MKSPDISVIVPVYNVEKYIDRCVLSILGQTHKSIEIILVDDGSTDKSGEICDKYQKSDSRVRVIHKHNGGLSSARNAGIDIANGNYIGFVDSDDYIELDMYELLYNNIIKEKADISVCGMYDCYKSSDKLKINPYSYEVLSKIEAIHSIFEGRISGASAVNKLYKRELFNNIRYPEGKTSEDAFVIVDILSKCSKVVMESTQKYYYYHRENSITTSKFSPRQFDVIDAYKYNYNKIVSYFPMEKNVAMGRLCWAYFVVLDRMISSNSCREYIKQQKEIVKFLRKHRKDVMSSSVLQKTRKCSMVVLVFSFELYKVLSKLNTCINLSVNR